MWSLLWMDFLKILTLWHLSIYCKPSGYWQLFIALRTPDFRYPLFIVSKVIASLGYATVIWTPVHNYDRKVHGLLRCTSVTRASAKRQWNRDRNGSSHIHYIAECALSGKDRPEAFTREKTSAGTLPVRGNAGLSSDSTEKRMRSINRSLRRWSAVTK